MQYLRYVYPMRCSVQPNPVSLNATDSLHNHNDSPRASRVRARFARTGGIDTYIDLHRYDYKAEPQARVLLWDYVDDRARPTARPV